MYVIIKNKKDRKRVYLLNLALIPIIMGAILAFFYLGIHQIHFNYGGLSLHSEGLPILLVIFYLTILILYPRIICEQIDPTTELEKLGYAGVQSEGIFWSANGPYKKTKNGKVININFSYVSKHSSMNLIISLRNPTTAKINLNNLYLGSAEVETKIGSRAKSLLTNSKFKINIDNDITLFYPWIDPTMYGYQDYDTFAGLVTKGEDVVFAVEEYLLSTNARK